MQHIEHKKGPMVISNLHRPYKLKNTVSWSLKRLSKNGQLRCDAKQRYHDGIRSLTGISGVVQHTGSTATASQEGESGRHQSVHNAALPWTQLHATSCKKRITISFHIINKQQSLTFSHSELHLIVEKLCLQVVKSRC